MMYPMILADLQSLWADRDVLYAGQNPAQDERSRPGELSTTEIAAIRQGRIREVNFLEPGERAEGWGYVNSWTPPLPYDFNPLVGLL